MSTQPATAAGNCDHPNCTIFITRNTEYHVSGGVCIAVRDRRTGNWVDTHRSLGRPPSGGIRFTGVSPNLVQLADLRAGDMLCFTGDVPTDSIMTSAVECITVAA